MKYNNNESNGQSRNVNRHAKDEKKMYFQANFDNIINWIHTHIWKRKKNIHTFYQAAFSS